MGDTSENDTERLFQHLRNTPLSEEPEKYHTLLQHLYQHPAKIAMLKRVFANVDNSTLFLGMGSAFFASMKTEQKDDCGVSILAFLSFSRKLCQDSGCDYDLLGKVVFAYLEKTRFRFLEVKTEVFSILEEVKAHGVSLLSHALAFLLTEQPVAILSEVLLFLGSPALVEVLKYVTAESEQSKSLLFQKNVGSLLLAVSSSLAPGQVFEVLEVYVKGLASEVQGLRNAAMESAVHLAAGLRERIQEQNRGERELSALTAMLCQRLLDVNFYCRSRAIQTLTEMLGGDSVLRTVRQKVIDQVLERMLDKTHIVRKKAVLFFKKALETHPFGLDRGALNQTIVAKARTLADSEYYRDFLQFHSSVQQSIANLKELLNTGAKGEITEIIQYLSCCTTYGVEEAMDVFPFLFGLAWNRVASDGKTVTDTLAEEIKRMSEGDPRQLVKLMVRFDSAALSYEGIVRELTLRGVLDSRTVQELLARIEQGEQVVPHLRLLRRITTTNKAATEPVLPRALSLLAREQDSAVLTEVVTMLGNLDYRVSNDSKVIGAIKSVLGRVGAYSLSLLQSVIDTCYLISIDPDSLAVETLEALATAGAPAPLVFAIGHVAIKEAVHLERLEAAWNHQGKQKPAEESAKKAKRDSLPNLEIRERRLSMGSRRNSLKITSEEQEEMADRIFFAKEHEIIFGEDSALRPFIEALQQTLAATDDPYLKKLALVSLGKVMAISSEFNSRHLNYVLDTLQTGPEDLKVICLMIVADSILAFSSLVGDISHHLFRPLLEEGAAPTKAAALVLIRHLLRAGMIKLKGKHWALAQLLAQELGPDVQRLFEEVMERETPLKTLCEVLKSYAKATLHAGQEQAQENRPGAEASDAAFLEAVRALGKLSGLPDLSKKLQDWLAAKNDPALLRAGALALSELAKGAAPAASNPPS